ncbi:MAG: methanogenesis marker 8 protein [Methanoregulaceae archaeon]|jgi:putative methanogenesis marker protein 8
MPDYPDEHIIEAIGRCRIIIRDGKVVSVGNPLIHECPLARRFAVPVHEISAEGVAENILHRVQSFGMCRPDRQVLTSGEFVGFGASELISFGLATNTFDAAVIACDGAGTVIATIPDLVQGIGGRMSGLVKTSPHPSVIAAIEESGGIVPFPETADIDQVRGVAAARAAGFSRIAVTIADPRDSRAIREAYPGAFIIAVHTTGLTSDQAATLADTSDVVTACASRAVREVAGSRALLQAGSSIPVFAMTQPAKDLILEKVRTGAGQFLVTGARLPFAGDSGPEPLI